MPLDSCFGGLGGGWFATSLIGPVIPPQFQLQNNNGYPTVKARNGFPAVKCPTRQRTSEDR
jgi:hypothetical protein